MNGTTKYIAFGLCTAVALLGTLTGGALAAFNPEGYLGTVIEKDVENDAFEVQTTHNWSDGGSCGEWQCSSTTIKWLFPNEDAANEICVGDYVEILGFAAPMGAVIGLGKMNSCTETIITDIYGDPNFLEPYLSSDSLEPPLLSDYVITYSSTPNCSHCGLCNCEASYTNVTITDGTGQVKVDDHQLYPGQGCTYEGMEYRIDVTFYSGEASACPECIDRCAPGPQPISDFTIHIRDINWNQWDDDCVIENFEISLAEYHWATNTPVNGHIITNSEISMLEYQWATGDVC